MIEQALEKIKKKENLTEEESEGVFGEIMTGGVRTETIASFLLLLKEKGESIEEITGAARIMREFATKIKVKNERLLDTCGTGGDNCGTFNISTVSAFVASAAGVSVAKHGNRAVSSRCGSADLLEELGVNVEAGPDVVERCINELGIGFLFAPKLHLAMKHAMPARKMINTRSIFNILGPLTNPAGARHQLLGVFDEGLTTILAQVLKNLGSSRALVAHGKDGLDEVTTTGGTFVSELKDGKIRAYEIEPGDFGFRRSQKKDLEGGPAGINAKIALDILGGKKGPKRDVVLLNAGCAIYVAGLAVTIKEGVEKAAESIGSGRALEKLVKLKKLTNEKS